MIADIQRRGKCPIVVGGSGLYLKFLTHGMAGAPPANEEVRTELGKLTVEEIYQKLFELDPVEAARQNAQNRRHLSRALEICLVTGSKASKMRTNFDDQEVLEGLRGVSLTWPREILAERIAQRTREMFEAGAVSEVESLPSDALTIRQAIGVKEIESMFRGEMTTEECEERIAISTRQYAKRQRNWLRRETWLYPIDGAQPVEDQVDELSQLDWPRVDHS